MGKGKAALRAMAKAEAAVEVLEDLLIVVHAPVGLWGDR